MKEFRFAVKQTIPIFFTYLFIGIAFGILMSDAGYGVLLTTASAFFIFAGSMQLVMVPMMTSGASLLSLALMSFFINARHIFYGIGFIEKFRRMGWRCPYMILTLTDETYSVLCSVKYADGIDEDKAAFLIALLDHLYWVFGCFVGACAGQFLQFDMRGIEFSVTDVVCNGAGEQEIILSHDAHLFTETFHRDGGKIVSVDKDLSLLYVIETADEVRYG